jgi:drug/metabolite transporter (DMT)-like permease
MKGTVAILLALLSATAYGTSDFVAGLASRRSSAGQVAVATQTVGLAMALIAVALFPGGGPGARALGWGALSGVGSAIGTLALYHGLAVGRMTVVATLSAVLTAVIPVIVGLALGNHLGPLAAAGIVLAIPAIALVSWQPSSAGEHDTRAELLFGTLAGVGFALLFIALAQAGTRAGAWPIVPGQLVSLLSAIPFAVRSGRRDGRPDRIAIQRALAAGVFSALANLLYLAATGHGELAVVAVLSALYPVVTVLAARVLLGEGWARSQIVGLAAAVVAVVCVTLG